MKRIKLVDEMNVPWLQLEGDYFHKAIDKLKLDPTEQKCWRDHLFIGLHPSLAGEAETRLTTLTGQCLEALEPNEPLLGRMIHAAQAYTLLTFMEEPEIANAKMAKPSESPSDTDAPDDQSSPERTFEVTIREVLPG